MDETDCEVPCPFIRLDARLAPGGGRGAARCGTSSEMGAVELGMVVMTGRLGSDLEGYGEEGDLLTGDPLGVGWNAAGGAGAAREGCIELCFGGACCGSILGKQTMPASWLIDENELVEDRDRRGGGFYVSNWFSLQSRSGRNTGVAAYRIRQN